MCKFEGLKYSIYARSTKFSAVDSKLGREGT
jgi:hypothetical protein